MNVKYTYVKTKDALERAAREWKHEDVLGIDIECENNLHHYGVYIAIIQISSKTKNWIIDVLELEDITPVLGMLTNHNIVKIFHDVSFDFRVLNYQFNIVPVNVFDTQIAALFLGKTKVGLETILHDFFQVEKEKKHQMDDWTKRPLTDDMLQYATKDSRYLIPLRATLIDMLKKQDRLTWATSLFKWLEHQDWTYKVQQFSDVKGIRKMSEAELGGFKHLFILRERIAKQINKPSHYIISTKALKEAAENPPTLKQWKTMKRVHPVVKQKAELFFKTLEQGRKEGCTLEKKPHKKLTTKQKEMIENLTEKRNRLAEKIGVKNSLILTNEQIIEAGISGNLNHLLPWQQELMK